MARKARRSEKARVEEAPLAGDLEYFQAHLPEWLRVHPGKYALVHDAELIGVYDNADNAYDAGVEAFGNVAFLIRQITDASAPVKFPALTTGLIDARPSHRPVRA